MHCALMATSQVAAMCPHLGYHDDIISGDFRHNQAPRPKNKQYNSTSPGPEESSNRGSNRISRRQCIRTSLAASSVKGHLGSTPLPSILPLFPDIFHCHALYPLAPRSGALLPYRRHSL